MMTPLPRPRELVEKMIVETRPRPWVGLSIGGCGILACTMFGRHDEDYMDSRRTSIEFAYKVIYTIGLPSVDNRLPTPQILVDTAAVINDPKDVGLLCTIWQHTPEEVVEICSVGTNSVLVFEGDSLREVIIPHSVANGFLQRYGQPVSDPTKGRMVTHVLGGRNSCSVDDVRIVRVPLSATTTIAIIVDRRLADAIIKQNVSCNDLPSFIEGWTPRGKRNRTSVLISL